MLSSSWVRVFQLRCFRDPSSQAATHVLQLHACDAQLSLYLHQPKVSAALHVAERAAKLEHRLLSAEEALQAEQVAHSKLQADSTLERNQAALLKVRALSSLQSVVLARTVVCWGCKG